MKTKLYTLLILLIPTIAFAGARTLNKAVKNGANWSSAGTWSLARIPQDGDSIVIPANTITYLDNSVTLDNVYITVGGMLIIDKHVSATLDKTSGMTIAAGALLTSLFFSPQEVISIGGVNKFVAKNDVVIAGPAYASSLSGTSPSGFSSTPSSLPVTFTSFTATRSEDAGVSINWNTVNEINNSHFDIERSADGSDWTAIGTVAAGNNLSANEYSYTDASAPAAQTWYRIRQVDLDGKYSYTKVVLVAANANAQATIITSGKTVTIFPEKLTGSHLMVRLITLGGQVLQQQSIESASSRIDLTLSTNASGMYLVQVTDGSQMSIVKKVML
jgi:hypothetical protein